MVRGFEGVPGQFSRTNIGHHRSDGRLLIQSAWETLRSIDPLFFGNGCPNLGQLFTNPTARGILGLSLCYGIVNEHGGTIKARSKSGAGAVFIIELPIAAGGAQALEHTDAPLAYWPIHSKVRVKKCS